ncbi:MAG: sugar phosphate isomerase/epimerase, partial [Pseudomonadota bacterium]
MKIGVMNDPSRPLEAQVRAMGEAGFDFLDLTLEGPTDRLESPERLRGLLASHGMEVVGHTDPALPWAYPLESLRRACLAELSRAAKTFQALGARVMNIHPCYAAPPRMKSRLLELNRAALTEVARMAVDHGLVLALENFLPPFDTVTVFRDLLDNAPGTALHLDAGHANLGGDDSETFIQALSSRLAHVHFSDNRGNADHHMPLGVGTVPWGRVVRALKAAGYDGTITLEVFCGDPDMHLIYLAASRSLVKRLWEN